MVNRKQVLLVDDDADFIEINKIALEKAGFAVKTAHSGKDGLEAAREGNVDAAVLDVIMATPDEGFELARALRKDEKTNRIPLLMLSSINKVSEQRGFVFRISDQDKDDMWLPIDRFVDKPVKPEKLVSLVKELVG